MRHVEELIREAMDRGEFDDLPGKGQPLDLTQDSLLDPLTAIVTRILKQNGVSHPLIEARKAIDADIAGAREDLARAWRAYQSTGNEEDWNTSMLAFRIRVKAINREVRTFNLKMPSPVLHGLVLDSDDEIRRVAGNRAQDRAST